MKSSHEEKSLHDVINFFTSNETNLKIFTDIIVFKKSKISLRLLEWFVTNYTKKNDITYTIARPQKDTLKPKMVQFDVYGSYEAQIDGFSKKKFDPYCRCNGEDLIKLEYSDPLTNEKTRFETSICQLNFFRWAIQNLVIDYVQKNYKIIYDDLCINFKKPKTKGKKTELSKSIYKNFVVNFTKEPIIIKI